MYVLAQVINIDRDHSPMLTYELTDFPIGGVDVAYGKVM